MSADSVNSEKIRLLFNSMGNAAALNFALGCGIAAVQGPTVPNPLWMTWLALLAVSQLPRLLLFLFWKRQAQRELPSLAQNHWLFGLRLAMLLNGLAWGSAAYFLFPPDHVAAQFFLAFVLAGYGLGAIVMLNADRLTMLAFVLPVLLPVVVRLLLQGNIFSIGMAALILLESAIVGAVALRAGRLLQENIELRLRAGEREQAMQHTAEALHETNQRLERIAARVPGMIVEQRWDAQGNKTLPFIGEGVKLTYGLSRAEVLQSPSKMRELTHPDDHAAYKAAMDASMVELKPFEHEWRLQFPDGHIRWLAGVGLPTREDDGATLLHGFIQDITERKRAELELAQHRHHLQELVGAATTELRDAIAVARAAEERAKAANHAKSSFLANMSHELRTPMNGMLGMADVLAETELNAQQQRMVQTMRNSSASLLSILNDILDFSKIEAGHMTLELMPLRLRDMVDAAVQLMQASCAAKACTLDVTIAPQLPAWVMGDATRLRQIIFNVLGNAVKFTAQGSNRAARISLRVEPGYDSLGANMFNIQIQDNGIGMAPETVTKLFQPFTQADESISRKFGGTGLGLSITRQLVALMGGNISVHSLEGEGSTFTIQLPLHEVPPEEIPATVETLLTPAGGGGAEPVQSAGQLILLAEDNETNREVMSAQLARLGYACEAGEDGEVALRMWRSGRYTLLLTDCHMPNMTGYDLTAAIRREEPRGTRFPIVAVTANALANEARRCLDAGMDDYLSKPLRMSELARVLAKWLPSVDLHATPPDPAATSADTPLPVWDSSVLTEMVGDNPRMQSRLLQSFLRSAQEQADKIQAAVQQGQALVAADEAHKLKSAARAVGALQLGAHCDAMELAGRGGELSRVQQLAPDIRAMHAAACALIQDELSRLALAV